MTIPLSLQTTLAVAEVGERARPSRGDLLLEVSELTIDFDTPEGKVRAVDNLNFEVMRGQTLAIVGESGCGKSVTAHALLNLIQPPGEIVDGSVRLHAGPDDLAVDVLRLPERSRALHELRGGRVGLAFQEASAALSPVHTIGHHLLEAIRLHRRLGRRAAHRAAVELLERVGMPEPELRLRQYPHELSGGMRQRALIALALAGDPELLIADEPTSALDVTLAAQLLRGLKELQAETGLSLLLITHDFGVVSRMADEVIVMYLGRVIERAPARTLLEKPRHPYTMGLLASLPGATGVGQRLPSIEGAVPALTEIPTGCPFHPRCPYAEPGRCDVGEPPPLEVVSLRVVGGRHANTRVSLIPGVSADVRPSLTPGMGSDGRVSLVPGMNADGRVSLVPGMSSNGRISLVPGMSADGRASVVPGMRADGRASFVPGMNAGRMSVPPGSGIAHFSPMLGTAPHSVACWRAREIALERLMRSAPPSGPASTDWSAAAELPRNERRSTSSDLAALVETRPYPSSAWQPDPPELAETRPLTELASLTRSPSPERAPAAPRPRAAPAHVDTTPRVPIDARALPAEARPPFEARPETRDTAQPRRAEPDAARRAPRPRSTLVGLQEQDSATAATSDAVTALPPPVVPRAPKSAAAAAPTSSEPPSYIPGSYEPEDDTEAAWFQEGEAMSSENADRALEGGAPSDDTDDTPPSKRGQP